MSTSKAIMDNSDIKRQRSFPRHYGEVYRDKIVKKVVDNASTCVII